ncbi:MAG: cob(I)yrinic acid a,c-diamide adenosyltransferase [Lachnotalea sp.]
MQKGLIHIYCGEGKGKTTTSMGLAVRAAGYGMKVLIYQFMKNNQTSERKILNSISNITIIDGLDEEKFSFQMTDKEKKNHKEFYTNKFREITTKATQEKYDMIVMDEIIYTIRAGLLDEELVFEFLGSKPASLEVVLTGNAPSDKLIEIADYVSEIKKVKHPFDHGQVARFGIEK